MGILDRIRESKLAEVAAARSRVPEAELRARAAELGPTRGFAAAIRGARPADQPRRPGGTIQVVAEVKKASPSVGVIRPDFDPVAIARAYAAGGAAAISCLTDAPFFQGSLEYLRRIREAVALPLLRKEFMLDPYQVWEARAAGADAILLIAGFVDNSLLADIRAVARAAGLDVLVEIHDADELDAALALDPDVLGINNRNLRDERFDTDLRRTLALAARVPPTQSFISESGIRTAADVERLRAAAIDGILVGEHLMREPDPGAAIRAKLGLGAAARP
ncbi:MAG TPA: indole-3-glycerol phosphate synthase TrpC [Candidatus Sumerlaeota bacterium]|nr:indole-3-glycerol phosphate synthase TrpC [Candidatus Sumerlaeota bacterium]